jgi:DNA-binding response OmpR family regulator
MTLIFAQRNEPDFFKNARFRLAALTPLQISAQFTQMQKVLVIEDDRAVQRALKRLFETEGFRVEISRDGLTGLQAFKAAPPSVVILDLRLPGLSGRDVCREIRKQAPGVPLIVLSAASETTDKVLLLELGADDYVTKPFSPRELLARVRAAMRHSSRTLSAEVSAFADVTVDFSRMQVTRSGESVRLTAQEFRLLKFFLQNPERVFSREELLDKVWGYENYPSTRTVDTHVMKLRQKLEANSNAPKHFLTVHGTGYKFVPEPGFS